MATLTVTTSWRFMRLSSCLYHSAQSYTPWLALGGPWELVFNTVVFLLPSFLPLFSLIFIEYLLFARYCAVVFAFFHLIPSVTFWKLDFSFILKFKKPKLREVCNLCRELLKSNSILSYAFSSVLVWWVTSNNIYLASGRWRRHGFSP